MIKRFLQVFNRKIVYVCSWGVYNSRYDSIDGVALRPIHRQMSVAPPWAKSKIIKIS